MSIEKQIEEMAEVIANKTALSILEATGVAEILTVEGYRKIPEGAIILTREEIAALNRYQKERETGGAAE